MMKTELQAVLVTTLQNLQCMARQACRASALGIVSLPHLGLANLVC